MKSNVNLQFSSNDYLEWYEENDYMEIVTTGLSLGLVFYSLYIFMNFELEFVLSFGVSFYDPSSAFAEHLIHLYNIVWIVLIFVVFFILVLLLRIIYLFNWNFFYFSSDMYLTSIRMVLEYLLNLAYRLEYKTMSDAIIHRLNIIDSRTSSLDNVGLNLWYNKDSMAFLSISDISEYRLLEVVWCLLPIGSLLAISTPTFSLIFSLDAAVDPAYTIKIIGRQWYWTYAADCSFENWTIPSDNPDTLRPEFKESDQKIIPFAEYVAKNLKMTGWHNHYHFEFDSDSVSEEDLVEGSHRLLEVNNRLVIPYGVPVRLLITSSDVLHSWAVPSLGIKVDAVPGRLNQFIVEIKRPGVFYGQCSELCGPYHGFMPIVVVALDSNKFERWVSDWTHWRR